VETPYNNTLKQMLSVRQTTCNDLVYLETGQTNAKSMVVDRQIKFLQKMKLKNSYVMDIVDFAIRTGSPMGKRIATILDYETCQQSLFMKNLNESVAQSESSRRSTYRDLNPSLEPSKALKMYTINESDRIALTRMRLGSHQLRVETGRWAGIPLENRTCPCNTGIQNELHVLLSCPRSQHIRQRFQLENINNLSELFNHDTEQLAEYCKLLLNLYRT